MSDRLSVLSPKYCRYCGECFEVVSGSALPCAWDSLSQRQRNFLIQSGMDAARWCVHRDTENAARPDSEGRLQLPNAKPIQGDLM